MSPFGAIYTLLDTWPTHQTRELLTSHKNASRCVLLAVPGSSLVALVTCHMRLCLISHVAVSRRQVSEVMRTLHVLIPVP